VSIGADKIVARKAEKNGLTDSEKQTNINDIRKFVSNDGVLKDHTTMIAAVAALLTAVAALLREIRAWGRRRMTERRSQL
jgi:hypothetical protein